VIFAGPKVEKGVVTKIVYEPGELGGGTIPPPTVPPPAGTGTSTGSTGGFTTETGSFGGDTGSTGASDLGGGDTGTAPSDTAAPEEVASEPTGSTIPEPEAMPGYVWLALLAGLVGWSLVRSVVLERSVGHRPNGVLAQIHQLNRGHAATAAAATATPGMWDAVRSGFGKVGHALSPVTSKVGSAFSKIGSLVRR
jgi:hypothetical protein